MTRDWQEVDLTVTLADAGFATLCVFANTSTGTVRLLPLFSRRSCSTLGCGALQLRRGAFHVLGGWKIGSQAGVSVSRVYGYGEISSLTCIGHAADSGPLNYGNVVGINGDGTADGSLQATFALTAGDHSLFIGGADIAGTNLQTYGFDVSLTVVPEPSIALLVASGAAVLPRRRRGIFSRGAGSGLP